MVKILVLILAVNAFVVFCGQIKKKNMWLWIVGYWLILTVKNVLDLINI